MANLFSSVCFEAIGRGLDNVSNNGLKCAYISEIRPRFNFNPAKNSLIELHMSRPTL